MPVASDADPYPQWGKAIAATRDALPRPLPAGGSTANGDGPKVALTLTAPAGARRPRRTSTSSRTRKGAIEPSGRRPSRATAERYVLTLPVANQLAAGFTQVAGVLAASRVCGAARRRRALDVPLAGAVAAGPKPASAAAAPTLNVAARRVVGDGDVARCRALARVRRRRWC